MTPHRRLAAVMLLSAWLAAAGCARSALVPVADRSPLFGEVPARYVVQPGDTLYSIAWRFGLDHKAIARRNGIRPPYTIVAGQRLTLERRAVDTSGSAPPEPDPAPTPRRWRPPTDAPVARGYGGGNRGLDYTLASGHPVRAAAAGEVVYAGSGLGGFRHLVIVKHDSAYLSAYSLDLPMAVREGQRVKVGDLLADKESGGRRSGTLHFEIRRHGEPVNPGALIGR